MTGGCCRRQPRRRGCGCGAVIAVLALLAAAAVAFLESTAGAGGGVTYTGDGWLHECAKWDADGARFLTSTFFGGTVTELRAGDAEERVVVSDPDAAGRLALGLAVDAPRHRLLVVYADRPPRFRYAALGAYDLTSFRRLFLTRLDVPGESTFADDVATDEEGNAYVTDARGSRIWKVSLDGAPVGVIANDTFTRRPGLRHNLIGLNGIVHHPNGYLLVVHNSGGELFKVDLEMEAVSVVTVLPQGASALARGDGMELLDPTRLVVAGLPNRLVESHDDWETATVVGRYVGPAHRIGSSATVKDGEVYINHIVGFGLARKKTHVLARAVFSPLAPASS